MAHKHTEDRVLAQLLEKHDVRVNSNKEVLILNGKSNKPQFRKKHDLGNKTWGKIDFLTKFCGYRLCFVAEWE